MPYAIMRWAKITSQDQANKAAGHNYRTDRVPNADKEAPHPNVEFINTAGQGYWELATERIEEVVTRKVRDDQVRCMEVILTASPEHFERDQNGRAVNMADSQWAKDQVDFLKKTFGEMNVLSCTLHQDEKSPHFHAIVVPITEDGRLSAKDLFNPKTLTCYQNEYAEAMKVHGLNRGVEHSQAKHQDMKRMYAQQAESSAEVGAQLGPASSYQAVQVKRPGAGDVLNLSAWEAKTTAQVNEQARAQVEAANQRAEKATNLAQENAAASERVRVLQKQLETVAGLKEAHFKGMMQAQEQAKEFQKKVNTVAMRLAGGETMPTSFIEEGNRLLDKLIDQLKAGRENVAELNEQAIKAEKRGDYGAVAELRFGKVQDQEKKNKPLEDELRQFVGGQARLTALDEEQAKREAEQIRIAAEQAEQARKARVAAKEAQVEQDRLDKLAQTQAQEEKDNLARERAAEQARLDQLAQDKRTQERANEKIQIELVSAQLIPGNHWSDSFFTVLTKEAAERDIVVESLGKGEFILSVKGSEHKFKHYELVVNGQSWADAVNTKRMANYRELDDFNRQRDAGDERGM